MTLEPGPSIAPPDPMGRVPTPRTLGSLIERHQPIFARHAMCSRNLGRSSLVSGGKAVLTLKKTTWHACIDLHIIGARPKYITRPQKKGMQVWSRLSESRSSCRCTKVTGAAERTPHRLLCPDVVVSWANPRRTLLYVFLAG
jgi:hypothetical protein